ncbi:hypothetical protein DYBT9623_01363 [Dyadobacter sp. CECT 9623]|uniref:VWFA domain-containing protein n=1 Tax=Dyadobacter linearis TaxID=2823330 RepID=A0ABM8UME1_9BACT|nr:von Willebrand factor type A domain-containing protein [Dyadobacter sp. CECT 9623]CAG5068631.1 hypothetical protein DYBT9623_01363 [Dyadobacter sp. CECT 9623]
MKGKIVILLALFLSAFALLPDRTLTGIVRDTRQNPVARAIVSTKDGKVRAMTDNAGKFKITVPAYSKSLQVVAAGFVSKQVPLTAANDIQIELQPQPLPPGDVNIAYESAPKQVTSDFATMSVPAGNARTLIRQQANTENYKVINETGFQNARQQAVTTFSVDVDRASYSNVRRFLNAGKLPPVDAIRIEEMINYFDYSYPQAKGEHPVAIHTELTDSPWNKGLKLLHIGMQAKTIPTENLPASNLVFLIDVSGSMTDENKLPLLKQAFKLLVDQLREKDQIAIVAYAGAAGTILPPTSGKEKVKIKTALDELEAGGSTAGGEGIQLAYKLAKDHFLPKGNNRVILATDGDFNVGVSSEGDLQRLIEEKRKDGIYLSVMGFGMGNYKDNLAETLADKGNGNYAYIDNIQEAQKEFVHEFGGTLFTVAKDVKIQIEFNPAHVQAYRLIGYENRALKNEEFHDDKKDAGEMGSGHTVTAIYEIVPAGIQHAYLPKTDDLKYQKTNISDLGKTEEMLTIKVRYKKPDKNESVLFDLPVKNASKSLQASSENVRFASAVAQFGLLLRNSEFKGNASYANVINLAKGAFGKDEEGYRSEFVKLVKIAQAIDNRAETAIKE